MLFKGNYVRNLGENVLSMLKKRRKKKQYLSILELILKNSLKSKKSICIVASNVGYRQLTSGSPRINVNNSDFWTPFQMK
jgi:hypothetical protein